jgi:hypothetical protein
MSSGFNRIFWGLLFVILDFRIMTFDLLIDAVGYFMIVSGLKILGSQSECFKEAQIIGVILGMLSIPSTVQFATTSLNVGILPTNLFIGSLFYSTLLGFLHIVLAFYIIQGLIGISKQANLFGLPEHTLRRGRFYIISSLIVLAATPFLFNVNDNTGMYMLFGIAIFSFILELLFTLLIRQYRNTYRRLERGTISSSDEV